MTDQIAEPKTRNRENLCQRPKYYQVRKIREKFDHRTTVVREFDKSFVEHAPGIVATALDGNRHGLLQTDEAAGRTIRPSKENTIGVILERRDNLIKI